MQEICTASQTERQEKMEKLSNPQKTIEVIKKYDFAKYTNSPDDVDTSNDDSKKEKFNPKKLDFLDDRNEFDPVQIDSTDSKYIFEDENAIVVNLKKGKKNDNN